MNIQKALHFHRIEMLDATGYAKFYSRSHDAVISVYGEADNVIETDEQACEFKEPQDHFARIRPANFCLDFSTFSCFAFSLGIYGRE